MLDAKYGGEDTDFDKFTASVSFQDLTVAEKLDNDQIHDSQEPSIRVEVMKIVCGEDQKLSCLTQSLQPLWSQYTTTLTHRQVELTLTQASNHPRVKKQHKLKIKQNSKMRYKVKPVQGRGRPNKLVGPKPPNPLRPK